MNCSSLAGPTWSVPALAKLGQEARLTMHGRPSVWAGSGLLVVCTWQPALQSCLPCMFTRSLCAYAGGRRYHPVLAGPNCGPRCNTDDGSMHHCSRHRRLLCWQEPGPHKADGHQPQEDCGGCPGWACFSCGCGNAVLAALQLAWQCAGCSWLRGEFLPGVAATRATPLACSSREAWQIGCLCCRWWCCVKALQSWAQLDCLAAGCSPCCLLLNCPAGSDIHQQLVWRPHRVYYEARCRAEGACGQVLKTVPGVVDVPASDCIAAAEGWPPLQMLQLQGVC